MYSEEKKYEVILNYRKCVNFCNGRKSFEPISQYKPKCLLNNCGSVHGGGGGGVCVCACA